MWAVATIDLRISNAEFMGLTPRQFVALLERSKALDKERGATQELLLAQIAAMIFNTRMSYSKEPVPVRDFLPIRPKGKDETRKRAAKGPTARQKQELIRAQWDAIMAAHGARKRN